MRLCFGGRAGGRSSGARRWWMLAGISCWTLCLVEQMKAPLVGSDLNPTNGVRRFAGVTASVAFVVSGSAVGDFLEGVGLYE